ncbi:40407_t:CDS:2, partial [Gigaspora margarita]
NLVRTRSIGRKLNLSNKVPKRKIDNEKNDDIKEERASKRNRPQFPENKITLPLKNQDCKYKNDEAILKNIKFVQQCIPTEIKEDCSETDSESDIESNNDDDSESNIESNNGDDPDYIYSSESSPCNSSGNIGTIIDDSETKVDLSEFEREYSKMNNQINGHSLLEKCLYHLFVIDPNDKIYVNEGVFTKFELDKIKKYKFKPLLQMPQGLLTYLYSFWVYDLLDLRKEILKTQQWDSPYNQKTYFDLNWIRNTMYNLKFRKEIFEIIFDTHLKFHRQGIWKYGQSGNFGKSFDGNNGSKLLKERGLKTPKMIKDMFYSLCAAVEMEEKKIRKLQSIGFMHADVSNNLFKNVGIPLQIAQFGSKVLPVVILAWKAK